MRFEFKPVVRTIDLGDYVEEMRGSLIPVWLNVPREIFQKMLATKGMADEEFFELVAQLWGDTWPVEDVRALRDHSRENDPQLWIWVTKRTWEMVIDYQAGQKKG